MANEQSSLALEIRHLTWKSVSGNIILQQDVNQQLGSLLDRNVKLRDEPGVHLVFMPRVSTNLDIKVAPNLASRLAQDFCIPEFFFNETGWDANGFFGSYMDPIPQCATSNYATFSRFLSKHASVRADKSIDYQWTYMAFTSLWRASKESGLSTLILLCFDLPSDVQDCLLKMMRESELKKYFTNPFQIFEPICGTVIEDFNRALWSYREPVRAIEKTRTAFIRTSDTNNLSQSTNNQGISSNIALVVSNTAGSSPAPVRQRTLTIGKEVITTASAVDLDKLKTRYEAIHELLRHTLHIAETLDVAARSLRAIYDDYQSLSSTQSPSFSFSSDATSGPQLLRVLRLSADLLVNLKARSQAFVDRLHNEAQLTSSIVAAYDARVSAGILEQTRNEGKSLADTVSVLTLLFLPGTFVSGFFGMNFFAFTSGGTHSAWFSTNLWVFFAVTAPLTFIGFVLFTLDLNLLAWTKEKVTNPLKNLLTGKRTKSRVSGSNRVARGGAGQVPGGPANQPGSSNSSSTASTNQNDKGHGPVTVTRQRSVPVPTSTSTRTTLINNTTGANAV